MNWSILETVATFSPARAIGRARSAAIAYGAASVLIVVGIGYLLSAAYIAAERQFGAIVASLGFGIILVLLGLILLVVYRAVSSVRARREEEKRREQLSDTLGAAAVTLLPALLRSKWGIAELLAPIVAAAVYSIYKENSKSDKR